MHPTKTVSLIALFTSLIITSDFALTPALNVKLVDTLVFASSYSFGFKIGACIAILSESIWSFVSPYGIGGYIIPFLVIGELLYVVAGYASSKIWRMQDISLFSARNFFFGAILTICAFIWDFETNIATGLPALWPNHLTIFGLLAFEIYGIPFMILHEVSDFLLGTFLAPIVIVYIYRLSGRYRIPGKETPQSLKVH
ncbi:MAG: hypothetical protein ACYC7D_15405 [Nitrososphaerales archaeon]